MDKGDLGWCRQMDLRLVLRAYALYNPELGYCQGMGMLVGLLLMRMSPLVWRTCNFRIHSGSLLSSSIHISQTITRARFMSSVWMLPHSRYVFGSTVNLWPSISYTHINTAWNHAAHLHDTVVSDTVYHELAVEYCASMLGYVHAWRYSGVDTGTQT